MAEKVLEQAVVIRIRSRGHVVQPTLLAVLATRMV